MLYINIKKAELFDYNEDITNLEFEHAKIIVSWNTTTCDFHIFNVYACISDDNNTESLLYIKPKEKYQIFEFEELFGFNCSCNDYDENKIIAIKYTNNDDITLNYS